MSVRGGLIFGVPALAAAALVAAAGWVGADRAEALECRFRACGIKDHAAQLCRAAEVVANTPAETRRARFDDRLSSLWLPDAAWELIDRLARTPAGARYEALLDELATAGLGEWTCPALARQYGPNLTISKKRILFDGKVVSRLRNGLVDDNALDGSEVAISALLLALESAPADSPLFVAFAPELSFELLVQVVYTVGIVGHREVRLAPIGREDSTVTIALLPYGTCPDCLAEAPEVRLQSPRKGRTLFAVVGRRTPAHVAPDAPLDAAGLLLSVAMSADGGLFLAGRGGVVPGERAASPTIRAASDGPDLRALTKQLGQIRGTFRDEHTILVTADLTARASHVFDVLLAATRPGLFTRPLLALPRDMLSGETDIATVFGVSRGVSVGTQAELTAVRQGTRPRLTRTPALTIRAQTPTPVADEGTTPRPNSNTAPLALDPDTIALHLEPQKKAIRDCYERALRQNRKLSGKMMLTFDIMRDGRVSNIAYEDIDLGSRDVGECIRRRAKYWRFPAPAGDEVTVALPLTLTPSG